MPPSPRRFVSSGAMVLDLETMNPLLNFQPTGADYSILADGGDKEQQGGSAHLYHDRGEPLPLAPS